MQLKNTRANFITVKIILFIIPFFNSELLYSQQTIEGKIMDAYGIGIPYASIYYQHCKEGGFASSNGSFNIKKIEEDSLVVSAIGYKTVTVPVNRNFLHIVLIPHFELLPDIIVDGSKRRKRKTELGFFDKSDYYYYSFQMSLEEAVFIPNNKGIKNGYIDAIKFRTAETKNSPFILCIRVYSLDSATGLPDKNILTSGNYIEAKDLNKTNIFSIKGQHLKLPKEGVFVSFQWIAPGGINKNIKTPYLIYNLKVDTSYRFAKDMGSAGWNYYPQKNSSAGNRYTVLSVSIIVSH